MNNNTSPSTISRQPAAPDSADFSDRLCPGATRNDLDPAALEAFRQKAPAADTFQANAIPYAALILFGKREALERLLPAAEILFEYHSVQAPVRRRFCEGFYTCVETLCALINERNPVQHFATGRAAFDIQTLNPSLVREALVNAVIHRDYRDRQGILIRQFPDHLEISNPGKLAAGVILPNESGRCLPRNPRLAELAKLGGLAEGAGHGIHRLFKASILEGKAEPAFSGVGSDRTIVQLSGHVFDPKILQQIRSIGEKELATLSILDLQAFNVLARGVRMPVFLLAPARALAKKGIFEKASPRMFTLARRFYELSGPAIPLATQPGTRDAMQAEAEVLYQHIVSRQDYGTAYAELQQLLPTQPRSHIRNLLHRLVSAKRVHSCGIQQTTRWFPGAGE